MSRLDTSQVEAGGEIARSPRSPSFPQPTTAAEVPEAQSKSACRRRAFARSVKQAARQLETFMQSMNRTLEFRVDQDSGRTVVTVKDKTTGETIRQIPSEEVMRLAHNLGGKAHSGSVERDRVTRAKEQRTWQQSGVVGGSSIDVNSLVSQLVAAERKPLDDQLTRAVQKRCDADFRDQRSARCVVQFPVGLERPQNHERVQRDARPPAPMKTS